MREDFKVPASELEQRKNRSQKALQESPMDGLLVIQRVDLFYFSGTAQNGFLYIPAEGEPLLMIKKYLPRAREESMLKDIIEIASVKEVPGRIADFHGRLPDRLGLEMDVLPVRDFNFYTTLFPDQETMDASPLILKVRGTKSPWEIEQMEKTAELSQKTFEYMKSSIHPGLTEMEFAGMFEAFARKHGHGGKMRVRDPRAGLHLLEVVAGAKGLALGGDDQHTRRRVGANGIELALQFAQHRFAQHVEGLRAVQRQPVHAARVVLVQHQAVFALNGGCCHDIETMFLIAARACPSSAGGHFHAQTSASTRTCASTLRASADRL